MSMKLKRKNMRETTPEAKRSFPIPGVLESTLGQHGKAGHGHGHGPGYGSVQGGWEG